MRQRSPFFMFMAAIAFLLKATPSYAVQTNFPSDNHDFRCYESEVCEEENDSPTSPSSESDDDTELEWTVLPLIHFYMDSIKRVVHLTPATSPLRVNKMDTPQINYNTGYWVEKWSVMGGALGLTTRLSFNHASGILDVLSLKVGMARVKGKSALYEYYVPTEEKIKTTKRKLPNQASQLDSWNEGDSVFFQKSGGMLWTVGGSLSGVLSAGYSSVEQGSWNIYVQKTEKKKAMVSFSRAKLKSSTLYSSLGVVLSSGRSSYSTDSTEGLMLEFDLTNDDAVKSYEDLMKGNAFTAQKMADDVLFPYIQRVSHFNYKARGVRKSLTLGLPIINWSRSSDKSENYYNVVNSKNGESFTTNYAVYTKSVNKRVINKHKNHSKIFQSGIGQRKNKEGKVISVNTISKIEWMYENDHSKTKSLVKAILKLKKDTGISVKLSDMPAKKKLKYTVIRLGVASGENLTSYLKNASNNDSETTLMLAGENAVNDYFRQGEDIDGLCDLKDVHTDTIGSIDMGTVQDCEEKMKEETMSALSSLVKLSSNLDMTKPKKYVKAANKIGKLVWKNQFTFHAMRTLMEACGAKMNIQVGGQKINNHQFAVETNHDSTLCNLKD
jgi:hypothetical protein